MHLKELPWYQALSFDRLGERIKGVQLMTKYHRIWEEALTARDSGYFATTPFFIPFTDAPEKLRTAQFSYLLGLCKGYMGNSNEAKALLSRAAELNNDLLFSLFYSK